MFCVFGVKRKFIWHGNVDVYLNIQRTFACPFPTESTSKNLPETYESTLKAPNDAPVELKTRAWKSWFI